MISKIKDEIKGMLANRLSDLIDVKEQRDLFLIMLNNVELTMEQRDHYDSGVKKLEEILDNNSLLFCKGIDGMMTDVIQFRAMLYAFGFFEQDDFTCTPFFKSWEIGMTYSIVSLFYKLIDDDKHVCSLANAWKKAHKYPPLNKSGYNDWIENSRRAFQTINYRNSIVSHNSNPEKKKPKYNWLKYRWEIFDHEFKQLILIWKLLSNFSDSLLIFPFIKGERIFSGMDSFIKSRNIRILSKKYDEFINMIAGQIS